MTGWNVLDFGKKTNAKLLAILMVAILTVSGALVFVTNSEGSHYSETGGSITYNLGDGVYAVNLNGTEGSTVSDTLYKINADGTVSTEGAGDTSVLVQTYFGIKATEYNPEFWTGWSEIPLYDGIRDGKTYGMQNWLGPMTKVSWESIPSSVSRSGTSGTIAVILAQGTHVASSSQDSSVSMTVVDINNIETPSSGQLYVVSDSGTLTKGSLSVAAGDVVKYSGSAWAKVHGSYDSKTVTEINGLESKAAGDCYIVSDSGTITAGSVSVSVTAGDAVMFDGTDWKKIRDTVVIPNGQSNTDVVVDYCATVHKVFGGWTYTDGGDEIVYPGDIVASDVENLYARWIVPDLYAKKNSSATSSQDVWTADVVNPYADLPRNYNSEVKKYYLSVDINNYIIKTDTATAQSGLIAGDTVNGVDGWYKWDKAKGTVKIIKTDYAVTASETSGYAKDIKISGNVVYRMKADNTVYDAEGNLQSFRFYKNADCTQQYSVTDNNTTIYRNTDTYSVADGDAAYGFIVLYSVKVLNNTYTVIKVGNNNEVTIQEGLSSGATVYGVNGWKVKGNSIGGDYTVNSSDAVNGFIVIYETDVDPNTYTVVKVDGDRMFSSIFYLTDHANDYGMGDSSKIPTGTYRTKDPYAIYTDAKDTREDKMAYKATLAVWSDSSKYAKLSGNTIFDNITFTCTQVNTHGGSAQGALAANGHRLILGTNISSGIFEKEGAKARDKIYQTPTILGGSASDIATPLDRGKTAVLNDRDGTEINVDIGTYVIIHSGLYNSVIAGGASKAIGNSNVSLSTYMVLKDCLVADTIAGGGGSAANVFGHINTGSGYKDGGTFAYLVGAYTMGDYWQDSDSGYRYFTSGKVPDGVSSNEFGNTREYTYNQQSSVVQGGSGGNNGNGKVYGSSHLVISGDSSVWDCMAGGRSADSTTQYAYMEITGKAEIRRVACGTITDGNSGGTDKDSVGDARIYIAEDVTVASVYGAGFDTWAYPNSMSMTSGTITIDIAGGRIGDVYGGGYRGSIGTASDLTKLDIYIKISGDDTVIEGNVYGGGSGGLNKTKHYTGFASDENADGNGKYGIGFQTGEGKDKGNPRSTGKSYVYGDIDIEISGGTVKGNVYGGGMSVPRLTSYQNSSVSNFVDETNSDGKACQPATVVGNVTVNIKGDAVVNGSVYGAGKGIHLDSEGEVIASEYGFNKVIRNDDGEKTIGIQYWAIGTNGKAPTHTYKADSGAGYEEFYKDYAQVKGNVTVIIENKTWYHDQTAEVGRSYTVSADDADKNRFIVLHRGTNLPAGYNVVMVDGTEATMAANQAGGAGVTLPAETWYDVNGGSHSVTYEVDPADADASRTIVLYKTSNPNEEGRYSVLMTDGNKVSIVSAKTANSVISLDTSHVESSVYGGGGFGKVYGSTTVSIDSGIVGINVFGGGLGTTGKTSIEGNRVVYIQGMSIIGGSVYGGSEVGEDGTAVSDQDINKDQKLHNNRSGIVIEGGYITGSVFGGGLMGKTYGNTAIYIGYKLPSLTVRTPVPIDYAGSTGVRISMNSVFAGGNINTSGDDDSSIAGAYTDYLVMGSGYISIYGNEGKSVSIPGSIMGSGNACLTKGETNIEINNLYNAQKMTGIHRATNVTIERGNIAISGRSPITSVFGQNKTLAIYGIGKLTLSGSTSISFDTPIDDIKTLRSQTSDGQATTEKAPQNRLVYTSGSTVYVRYAEESTGNPVYGTVEGFVLMVSTQGEYGAYAMASDVNTGGFSVNKNGSVTEADTSVAGDICCWFVSGISKKISTMYLQLADDSRSLVNDETYITINKFQTDTSMMFTGGVFTKMANDPNGDPYTFVRPGADSMEDNPSQLSLALGYNKAHPISENNIVYDPTFRMMQINGGDYESQPGTFFKKDGKESDIDGANRDRSLVSVPMTYSNQSQTAGPMDIYMCLSGMPVDGTAYVGYLTLVFQEVKQVNYESVGPDGTIVNTPRYLVANTIELRIDIYIYGSPASESSDSFYVEIKTTEDASGNRSGDASTLIPQTYSMAELSLAKVELVGAGAGSMSGTELEHVSNAYVLPDNGYIAPTGKAFDRWKLTSGNAVPIYGYPGDTVSVNAEGTSITVYEGSTSTIRGNFSVTGYALTITPMWKTTMEVVFYANGGDGTMSAVPMKSGTEYVLPTPTYTPPSGKAFAYWEVTIGSDRAETRGPGDVITIDGSTLIKAVWAAGVTVKFSANSGGTGTMEDVYAPTGERYTLPMCEFTPKSGKQFENWSVSINGGSAVKKYPGDTVKIPDKATSVTITANWLSSWTSRTVTFEANGGSEAASIRNLAVNAIVGGVEGWHVKSSDIGTSYAVSSSDDDAKGFIVVYRTANAAEKYTVVMVGDSGTTVHRNLANNDSFDIDGTWKDVKGTTHQNSFSVASAISSGLFDSNGFTVLYQTGNSQDRYTVVKVGDEMSTAEVANGTKYELPECGFAAPSGKIFAGWSVIIAGGSPSVYQPGTILGITGDTVITAQWATQYTITFGNDGGTGSMVAACVPYESEYVVPECGFTPISGNVFLRWGSGGNYYYPGQTITVMGNMDLTAEWRTTGSVKVRVAFDAAGEGGYMSMLEKNRGSIFTLPESGFTSNGRVFLKWNVTVGTSDPVELYPGNTIELTDDTVLSAIWASKVGNAKNIYTVITVGNSSTSITRSLKSGDSVTINGTYTDRNGDSSNETYYVDPSDADDYGFIVLKGFSMTEGKYTVIKVAGMSITPSKNVNVDSPVELTADNWYCKDNLVSKDSYNRYKVKADDAISEDYRFIVIYPANVNILSFEANDGTGEMDNQYVLRGNSDFVLPSSGFAAPAGKVFDKWTISSGLSSVDAKPGQILYQLRNNAYITDGFKTVAEINAMLSPSSGITYIVTNGGHIRTGIDVIPNDVIRYSESAWVKLSDLSSPTPDMTITTENIELTAQWKNCVNPVKVGYTSGATVRGVVKITAEANQDNTTGWSNLGSTVVWNLANGGRLESDSSYIGTLLGSVVGNVNFAVEGLKAYDSDNDEFIPTVDLVFDRGGVEAHTRLTFADVKEYAVVFVDHGIEDVRYYPENTLLSRDQCNTPSGNNFNGWYLDSTFVNRYDYNMVVNDESDGMKLYARYTYVVTLDCMNGIKYTLQVSEEDSGALLTESDLPVPEYTGFTFDGWCKDYNRVYDWSYQSDRVYEDTTLYARWIGKEVRIYFWYEDDKGNLLLFDGDDTGQGPDQSGKYNLQNAYAINRERNLYPTVTWGGTFDVKDPYTGKSFLETAQDTIDFKASFVKWTVVSPTDPSKHIGIYSDTVVGSKTVQYVTDEMMEGCVDLWEYYVLHDGGYPRVATWVGDGRPDTMEVHLKAETTKVAIKVSMGLADDDQKYSPTVTIDDPEEFLVYPNGPNLDNPVDVEKKPGAFYDEFGEIYYAGIQSDPVLYWSDGKTYLYEYRVIDEKTVLVHVGSGKEPEFYWNSGGTTRYIYDEAESCWTCLDEAKVTTTSTLKDNQYLDYITFPRKDSGQQYRAVSNDDQYGNTLDSQPLNFYLKSVAYVTDGNKVEHKYLVEWNIGADGYDIVDSDIVGHRFDIKIPDGNHSLVYYVDNAGNIKNSATDKVIDFNFYTNQDRASNHIYVPGETLETLSKVYADENVVRKYYDHVESYVVAAGTDGFARTIKSGDNSRTILYYIDNSNDFYRADKTTLVDYPDFGFFTDEARTNPVNKETAVDTVVYLADIPGYQEFVNIHEGDGGMTFYLKDESGKKYSVGDISKSGASCTIEVKSWSGNYHEFVYKLNNAVRSGYTLIGWHNQYVSLDNALSPSAEQVRKVHLTHDMDGNVITARLITEDSSGNVVETPLLVGDYIVDPNHADASGTIVIVQGNPDKPSGGTVTKVIGERTTQDTVTLDTGTWYTDVGGSTATTSYPVAASDADIEGTITIANMDPSGISSYTITVVDSNGYRTQLEGTYAEETELLLDSPGSGNAWRTKTSSITYAAEKEAYKYEVSEDDSDVLGNIVIKAVPSEDYTITSYTVKIVRTGCTGSTEFNIGNLEEARGFEGWYVNSTLLTGPTYTYNSNDAQNDGSIVLVTKWRDVTQYTIKWKNGSSYLQHEDTGAPGDAIQGSVPEAPGNPPEGGWGEFLGWKAPSGMVDDAYVVNVGDYDKDEESIILYAIWENATYTNYRLVLVNPMGDYGVTYDPGRTAGYTEELKTLYDDGYRTVGWRIVSGENPRLITSSYYVLDVNDADAQHDIILVAEWAPTYTVIVSGHDPVHNLIAGESVVLEYANKNSTWKVMDDVLHKGGEIDNPLDTFDMHYEASWERIPYTLHLSQPANGTIEVYLEDREGSNTSRLLTDEEVNSMPFYYGDKLRISYTPNNNKVSFIKWVTTNTSYIENPGSSSTVLIIQDNCSIAADESTGRMMDIMIAFDDDSLNAQDREYTRVFMRDTSGEYWEASYIPGLVKMDHYIVKVPYGDGYEVVLWYGWGPDAADGSHQYLPTFRDAPDEYVLTGTVDVTINGDSSVVYDVISAGFINTIDEPYPIAAFADTEYTTIDRQGQNDPKFEFMYVGEAYVVTDGAGVYEKYLLKGDALKYGINSEGKIYDLETSKQILMDLYTDSGCLNAYNPKTMGNTTVYTPMIRASNGGNIVAFQTANPSNTYTVVKVPTIGDATAEWNMGEGDPVPGVSGWYNKGKLVFTAYSVEAAADPETYAKDIQQNGVVKYHIKNDGTVYDARGDPVVITFYKNVACSSAYSVNDDAKIVYTNVYTVDPNDADTGGIIVLYQTATTGKYNVLKVGTSSISTVRDQSIDAKVDVT